MASLAFSEDFIAVDVDAPTIRANAREITVSKVVTAQLVDRWGELWRGHLTAVLEGVSDVWRDSKGWRCLSGETVIMLSENAQCVVGVWHNVDLRPPGDVLTALASGDFRVPAATRSRLRDLFGDDWRHVLLDGVARIVATGQVHDTPQVDVVRIATDRESLRVMARSNVRLLGVQLRVPEEETVRKVLRCGLAPISHHLAVSLEQQFGEVWDDVFTSVCRYLAEGACNSSHTVMRFAKDSTSLVIRPGLLVTQLSIADDAIQLVPADQASVERALTEGEIEVSPGTKKQLAGKFGRRRWKGKLDEALGRVTAPSSSRSSDKEGRFIELSSRGEVVRLRPPAQLVLTLGGETTRLSQQRVEIVDARIAWNFGEAVIRPALAHGRVVPSEEVRTGFREQFGDPWKDILLALCTQMAGARCHYRTGRFAFTDGSAQLVITRDSLITFATIGSSAQRHDGSHVTQCIENALANRRYHLQPKVARRLQRTLGESRWESQLDDLFTRLTISRILDRRGTQMYFWTDDRRCRLSARLRPWPDFELGHSRFQLPENIVRLRVLDVLIPYEDTMASDETEASILPSSVESSNQQEGVGLVVWK